MTKIIRVFPGRTSLTPDDDLAFIGDPPLWRPEADEVHVSCAFTWDKPEAERLAEAWALYYPNVKLGGPAYNSPLTRFIPGQYIKQGVTFTSRGCVRKCPFCLVPKREGKLTPIPNFADGYIINDNNFLACPKSHREAVYAMLNRQSRAAIFAGGIDARLVDKQRAAELKSIRIHELFLAADDLNSLDPLRSAVELLAELGRPKLRCYVLCAFDGESIEQAEYRLEKCWEIGVMPFAQLFQPDDKWIDYNREWRALQRKWSRPAAMVACHR